MSNLEQQCSIGLFASDRNWFEGKAIDELLHVSRFAGMRRVVGFPDMHSGLDTPNGAAFVSEGIFYPHLIGNDIGCGYGLWQTGLHSRKLKLERWTGRLHGLDQAWEEDACDWLAKRSLQQTAHDASMGTIGGGNHFAELQKVQTVFDIDAFAALPTAGRAGLQRKGHSLRGATLVRPGRPAR